MLIDEKHYFRGHKCAQYFWYNCSQNNYHFTYREWFDFPVRFNHMDHMERSSFPAASVSSDWYLNYI